MPATTPDQPEPENPANRETVRITVREQETVRLTSQRSGPARGARPGRPARRPRRAPLPLAAAVATLWAALISYLPVTAVLALAQLAEDAGSLPGAARLGLAGWLLGHGVPLDASTGPLGLAPLALAAFAAWRVSRAGVHVSRAVGARRRGTPLQALAVAGAVGLGYGVIGLLAAVI